MTRVAYVVGRHPGISHTFITREIAGLRALGAEISTFSVWRTPKSQLLSEADRREAAGTKVLLPPTQPWVLRAQAAALAASPVAWTSMVQRAIEVAPPGGRRLILAGSWIAEAAALWHACRRADTTHIHAHLSGTAPVIAMLAAGLGNSIEGESGDWTWSMTVHGPTEFYAVEREALPLKVREADFVVCISDFARSQLMAFVDEAHWEKLEVVHCGVDPQHFAPVSRQGRTSVLELLCVARLTQVKGQAVALRAVQELLGRGMDVHLTIVGDGPKRERLEQLAQQLKVAHAVTFEGARGQDEISRYFERADIFLLTSFAEGVPVVLMEAMATELPVVAPSVMGVGELVEDGVNGRLVRPGRAGVFAEVLSELAQDPEERLRLGRAGRETVLQDFNIVDSAQRLKALFG